MKLHPSYWILAFLCIGCTRPAKTSMRAHREVVVDSIWSLVPGEADWMLLTVPGRLPAEVLAELPELAQNGPCREGAAHTVLFLHGTRGPEAFSATVRLFEGARAKCTPEGVKTYRSNPVLSEQDGIWELWTPGALVRAPVERAQYLADRVGNPAGSEAVEPAALKKAVSRWQPRGESAPAVALWFVRSERIARFFKPLFAEPPLRGGLLFFFSGGWVRLRIHLEFGDTGTAEAAVSELRDGLISAIESRNYPRMDWKTALEPLVVHPEGSLLWVQWSMPVARALPLFFAVAGKG
ncbi:hypothetical protein KKD52_15295 [Myxococcota bacterium]|nr:hypothetical protein [Myxococcota bacterium]MBU1413667.1 hypothetical protein [Myxococcota bacterium]MBU1511716.1 hypothetical protein [Myxococcota bacterium]